MLLNNSGKNKIPKKTILIFIIIVCVFMSLGVFLNGSSISKYLTSNTLKNLLIKNPSADNGMLKVYFMNVGEGDSALVLFPNGENLLIDAGHKSDGKNISGFLKRNGVKKLNYVLATHPDKDHIGGLEAVLNDFYADNIFAPDVSKDSKVFSDVTEIIQRKGLDLHRAYGGDNLYSSNGVRIDFLAPNSPLYKDTNDYSAVIKIKYKQTTFLFMGDAGETSEKEMLKRYNLSANVIKIAHHGEKSSASQALIDSVKPQYAIISAASYENNAPYEKVVDKLKKSGVTTFITGAARPSEALGNILFTSDGSSITVN